MSRRMIWLLAALGGVLLLKLLDKPTADSSVAVVAPVARPSVTPVVAPAGGGNLPLEKAALPTRQLPWPVVRDPFQPVPPTAPKDQPGQFVQAVAPPPPPSAPATLQIQRPRPAVFGMWRDEKQTRVMLATPSGVIVAGVGENVMSFRVETIGSNTVSLLDTGSGERVVLSSPSLPRPPQE